MLKDFISKDFILTPEIRLSNKLDFVSMQNKKSC